MATQQYQRESNGRRFILGGMSTAKAVDLLGENEWAYAQNVRRYLDGRAVGRATSSNAIYTLGAPPHTIRRLNDSTPAGPVAGFVRVIGAAGIMYVNAASVASGFSGNPVSLVPFRPNTSVQPWMYVADSAQYPSVTIGSFHCAGMVKIRSDALTRKTGIAEPQIAPTVTFPSGGNGPSQIFYYYTYRASETGATSNPSPVSVPGTNSQSNPTETIQATSHSNFSFNSAQYEFNGSQIRTTGSVPANTLTDYIVATGFGFSIPENVTVSGIQIDLNWVGQNAGTGLLVGAALYYLGAQFAVKNPSPGVANQSFSSDTLLGGSGDTWGASTLSPDMLNDPSFGFGIQILTQSVGGSDRSFVNSMAITIYYSTQDANITPTPSSDPQVDKIDIYRQGGGLANPTYVGTTSNTTAVFNDTLSDLAAADNPVMDEDNFEPFPSIDLSRSGTLNASSNVLTWVSGDQFNIRWLPGTVMLIGPANAQVAYSAVRRPSSTTSWDFTNNDPNVPAIPDGTGLQWNIAEPSLAQQPMPSMWGPTDNAAYMFACNDPLRPGTLYYTKGNNPDSAPDSNQIEVTSPSEPLMNGCIISGVGMVFSTEHAWLIYPTFTTALATVSGVAGQAFNLIQSITNRGLYIRNAICTESGKNVFFRAKDGIYVSPGGAGSQSITDAQIYNLFPHEGVVPTPVVIGSFTVFPPDDTKPEAQKLNFANGYLYYDYQDTTGTPRTLVFDAIAQGWSVDVGNPVFTTHALEEGPSINDTIVGCSDSTVRVLNGTGTEIATSVLATGAVNSGDSRAFKRIGDVFIKALVKASNPITLALYSNRYQNLLSGYSPTSLTGTGSISPYIVDFDTGFAQDVIDIEAIFSWPTGSGNTLEFWQPDWISLPEETQSRPTDWDNAGSDANKFVQGMILECNTFGQAKTFSVEDDQGGLHTPVECPFTTSSQTVKTFTFSPPFTTHMMRIVTTDGVPWQIWPGGSGAATWMVQPYPEQSTTWVIEATSLGIIGYGHLFAINLAYIASQDVTVTVTTDGAPASFSMTFPAGGSGVTPVKIFMHPPANKWKIIQITVTSTAPLSLWKNLCEFWIGVWGRSDAYMKRTITGSGSALEGADI